MFQVLKRTQTLDDRCQNNDVVRMWEGKTVSLWCKTKAEAIDVAQSFAVSSTPREHRSGTIINKKGRVVMRYWWDDGLQYMEY